MLLVSILEVGVYFFIIPLLESVIRSIGNPISGIVPVTTVPVIGQISASVLTAIILGVYGVKTVITVLVVRSQVNFSKQVETDLAEKIFENFLRMQYSESAIRTSASFVNTVIKEVELYKRTLISFLSALTETVVITALLSLLILIAPTMTLALMISVAVIVISYWMWVRRRLISLGARLAGEVSSAVEHVLHGFQAIAEIKVRNLESYTAREFAVVHQKLKQTEATYIWTSRLPASFFELAAVTGIILAAVVGRISSASYEGFAKDLAILAVVSFRFVPSANRIVTGLTDVKFAGPTIERIDAQSQESSEAVRMKNAVAFSQHIEVRDVAYRSANDTRPLLSDVSFKIHSGEMIGIIGESGAGKSTLIKLLLGLLTPEAGVILIDGHVFDSCTDSWSNSVGYAAQNPVIVSGSIAKNIAFGPMKLEDHNRRVHELARELSLDHLDLFGDDILGEGGERISGGELQRVAIARAFYGHPQLIILDEVTSSQDAESAETIEKFVRNYRENSTIIVVSHQQFLVRDCHRLLVLEGGTVRESSPES